MENDIVRLKQEVEELRKAVLEIQQKSKVVPEPSFEEVPPTVKGGFTDEMEGPAKQIRELLQGEPLILVFNLGGFCVVRGRIWTHETGYSGRASFAGNPTMFFVPKDKVRENRSCPEEVIEKYFSIFSSRQRISLMRALLNDEIKNSAKLREEAGLTEGQFYHHTRGLAAAGCILKKGQDQYCLSDTGKILLLIVEAFASELEASVHLRPEEIKSLIDTSDIEDEENLHSHS